MATSTPRLTLPLAVGSDAPSELRMAIGQLSTALDAAAVYSSGTIAGRAGLSPVAGQFYYATDIVQWAVYNGSAWQPLRGLTGTFQTGSTYTAKDGDLVETGATGAMTITLPNVAAAHSVGVTNFSGHGVIVQRAGGALINGPGLGSVSQFALSQPGSFIVLNSDGANWFVVAGGQDTGWVPLTLAAQMSAAAGYYVPAARLTGDRVTLRGGIKYAVANPPSFGPYGTVATAGVFPASTVGVPLSLQSGNTIGGQITTAGAIQSANGSVTAGDIVQLDGLNYSLT